MLYLTGVAAMAAMDKLKKKRKEKNPFLTFSLPVLCVQFELLNLVIAVDLL